MALSLESVNKAWALLNTVAGSQLPSKTYTKEDDLKTDVILLDERKADGGYEAIVVNIRNITRDQLAIFNEGKSDIPNTSINSKHAGGITRIGWF